VPFTTYGTFQPGNVFKVQIAPVNGTFTDLAGTFSASPAIVRLPMRLPYDHRNYQVRVVATVPEVNSNPSAPFRLNEIPEANLLGNSRLDDYADPGTPVHLQIQFSGGGPVSFVLSDSSRTWVDAVIWSTLQHQVRPEQTTIYRVVQVANACGPGQTQGETTVNVNRTRFMVTALSDRQICAGATLYVSYDSEIPFPANTPFTVELSPEGGGEPVYVQVSGSASPLAVPIPATLARGNYGLRLRSEERQVSARYEGVVGQAGSQFLEVKKPVTANLSGDQSVRFGQKGEIRVELTGNLPAQLTLHNGALFYADELFVRIPIEPLDSQTYTLRSVRSQCGPGTVSGMAEVQVLPGLRIDSLSSLSACAGSEIGVFYSPSKGIAEGMPKLSLWDYIEFHTPASELVNLDPVRGSAGRAFYRLPESMNGRYYSLRLVQAQEPGTFFTSPLLVVRPPTIMLAPVSYPLDSPQQIWMMYYLDGAGRRVDFTLSNGVTYTLPTNYDNTFPLFVPETTTYSVTAVRNECGSGTATGATKVVVKPYPEKRIFLSEEALESCPGGRVGISFALTGGAPKPDEYRIEISNRYAIFEGRTLKTVTEPGRHMVEVPREPGKYRLRISSVNPALRSNETALTVADPGDWVSLRVYDPTTHTWSGGNVEMIRIEGDRVGFELAIGGLPPFRYELSDGLTREYRDQRTWFSTYPKKTTEYWVRSAVNRCNQATGTERIRVIVQPYELRTYSVPAQACAGSQIQVPFHLRGNLPESSVLKVQFSTDTKTFFDLPTNGRNSPLSVQLPDTLAGGIYSVRIVGTTADGLIISRPSEVYADNPRMAVRSKPKLRFTASDGSDLVEVEVGAPTTLRIQSSEPGPLQFTLNSGQVYSLGSASKEGALVVQPTNNFTYRIQSVKGWCGYQAVSDSVRVRYRPGLRSLRLTSSATTCVSTPVHISYQSLGDFPPENIFQFWLKSADGQLSGQMLVAEDRQASGELVFYLPKELSAGQYTLRLVASSQPSVSLQTSLAVETVPSGRISGSTSTYTGTTVSFPAVFQGGQSIIYTLSDGTAGRTTTSGNQVIPVNASETTTFRLVSIQNNCGITAGMGEATVEVLPGNRVLTCSFSSELKLRNGRLSICPGEQVQLSITSWNPYNPWTRYKVQISDSTGANFRDLGIEGNQQAFLFRLSTGLPPGDAYRFRIVSANPDHVGAATNEPVRIETRPAGVLEGRSQISPGDSARLLVQLQGEPPWLIGITDSESTQVFPEIWQKPFVIKVAPKSTTTYRLITVSNAQCGIGTAQGLATVTVVDCLEMTTVKAGAWDDPTVWACGRVPAVTDAVIIRHSVSVPNDLQTTIKTLRIELGATVSLGANAKVEVLQ